MTPLTVNVDMLKELVITELGHHSRRPTELLNILGDGYPDSVIKEVVLRLLQEGRIEMTPNRELHVIDRVA